MQNYFEILEYVLISLFVKYSLESYVDNKVDTLCVRCE